ncbi:hypothetical protein [Actinophytocola sp.]|uniref:hypothetical protein n=1 Tax=Actinophytocola sp. TaxID=1872138 RepID=UPI002D80F5AC|nr:hypothetical protein [Actinophytocola sp.]HET9143281.1 hypothetical protein [Actinophytocola sp.]
MGESELHVQASLWNGRARTSVLLMEGAARDRAGGLAVDALHRIALARGLRLTTDLDRRDPRPVRGWRVRVDRVHAVTLEWPHRHPLLDRAPVELPSGWLRAAAGSGEILLVIGFGLGLREPVREPDLFARLERAARDGALVTGTLALHTADPDELPAQRVAVVPGDDRIGNRLDEPVAVGAAH